MSAETILLKKGGTLKGKVVSQDQNKIILKKDDGTQVSISKSEILKVVYKENLTALEEEKLRKAEEEKERIRKEKEEAARLKQEEDDSKLREKQNAEALAKKQAEEKALREAEEKRLAEERSKLTRVGATWRSAVLPGWGQWKQGRKWQAILYPTLVVTGLFFTYDKHRMYLNAKRDYNNLENPYTEESLIRSALLNASGTPQPALSPQESLVLSQLGPFPGQRESVERHYREMTYIAGATALVYLWNIFDAFWFHPKPQGTAVFEEPTRTNQFFLRNTVENATLASGARGLETRTHMGYEFSF